MKQGMIDIKLVDVCGIQYGCPFDASLFSTSPSEGMPLIRIRDVKGGQTETYYSGEYSPEFIIRKGDYLIGMDGEFNIAPWQSEDALLNQRVCKIYTKSHDVVIRYVYRFLQKELKKIEDETPFVTVKHLSAKRLNQVYLPVPPIAEQEKIVAELDCLSGIIEKKKQQLKELDNLAQSIFYEMFGDPVENDKGWEVKTYGSEFQISSGGTPDTKNNLYWDNGDISWIGSNLCHDEIIYKNDGKYITKDGFDNSSAKEYKSGYVLVALVGATIGRTALLRFNTTTNQNVAGINVPANENFVPEFIFYHLQKLYELFMGIGNGKFKMANLRFIRELPLIVPSLSFQQDFASKIEAIEKQKELIAQSIKETETLFNSRMDYYFN